MLHRLQPLFMLGSALLAASMLASVAQATPDPSLNLLGLLDGWLISALRSSTPILLVVLGETLTQRVGVINLGVEGQMLVGASAGFAAAVTVNNPWIGLLVGALAGFGLSMVHGLLCIGCRSNSMASGVAVWILGSGLSAFFGRSFVGQKLEGFQPIHFPQLQGIPIVGALVSEMTPTIGLAFGLAVGVGLWLYGSRSGLVWRAVGESPEAVRAIGIQPQWIQLQGIGAGGLLSGLGGAALSVDYTLTWAENMTAGRGLVAVGLVIVAAWNPFLAIPAALLFGGTEALYLRLQAAGVPISSYLLGTLPYLVSLAVLVVRYRQTRQGGMPAGLQGVFDHTA